MMLLTSTGKGVWDGSVVVMEFPGTIEQYDQVMEKMQLGDKVAPNGIFHVCADNGRGGVQIVDVWETPEAFQKFTDEQTLPITAELGITGQPKVTVLPVHNMLER